MFSSIAIKIIKTVNFDSDKIRFCTDNVEQHTLLSQSIVSSKGVLFSKKKYIMI